MRVDKFQVDIDSLINNVADYSDKTQTEKLTLNALALVGEAGEIANKIKKHVWYSPQNEDVLRKDIEGELGDVMYHVSQLATECGIDLNDIMFGCVNKAKAKNDKHGWNESPKGILPTRIHETDVKKDVITSNASWTMIDDSYDTHTSLEEAKRTCEVLLDNYGKKPCSIRGICIETWVAINGVRL